jgi:hypothetical protein
MLGGEQLWPRHADDRAGMMTKAGNAPRQPARKARRSKQAEAAPSVEDALNRTFHELENESVPDRINRLAEELDAEISRVIKKKSH